MLNIIKVESTILLSQLFFLFLQALMKQNYEDNKRRIQIFKLTADVKDDNGVVHHFFEGYEYVEIGGLKWATCNVGAQNETDSGLYFAWGEIKGYTADQVGNKRGQKMFNWDDYEFGGGVIFSKYSIYDGLTTLEACDDAATQNMCRNWRVPTKAEFDALLSATTNEWATVSGVKGRLFTSTADTSVTLFFPAVGNCDNGSVGNVGFNGVYWSSSLSIPSASYGACLYFGGLSYFIGHAGRQNGFSVRAVFG